MTQGAGVTVAVIDSGVNPDVSDLSGSVTTGPDYTGVSTRPASPNWGVHGTWMASLIAGHGHDGGFSGVIGVAPEPGSCPSGSSRTAMTRTTAKYEREQETVIQQSLADGIHYAVTHGARGHQHVDRLQRAERHGQGRAAAGLRPWRGRDRLGRELGRSGRSGPATAQAPESFPADYPGVISVGAVNSAGAVAAFSSDNLSVQVAAPGVSVPAQGRDGQYWWVSGTSPACALVAGVAALIKSRVSGSRARPGGQRADLDDHRPAGRRLRQPGGFRHRQRGRGPGPGRKAGRCPAERPASRPPPSSAAARMPSPAAGPPPRIRPARPVRATRASLAWP